MTHDKSIMIPEADWLRLNRLATDEHLKSELDNAVVIDAADVPPGLVTMDSCVRFQDETTGATREVTIVFPDKANASQGKVSVLAPVGSALLGLCVGQSIQWPFPDGSKRKLRVLDLLYQPEASPALG